MPHPRIARALPALVLVASLLAPSARAELTTWDQAQVTALGKELVQATNALYETFRKQPPPSVGSMQGDSYQRLKQFVRLLHVVSQEFAGSLEKGEGRVETLTIFDNLMQLARSARDEAARVFVAHDVSERASAVRQVLNRLGPYYDPDFPILAPHPNIEPGAAR
ncbi:MAG TPA: hypothetical protein VMW19_03915 [Myxococcota bacterium]|nr:hypothetical protein [Myxococcota bacterium]